MAGVIFMKKERGFAYCGLACCLCENEGCIGCRNEGCEGRQWCAHYNCCREKGYSGCWECGEFPCEGAMFGKVKPRAFAGFIAEHGEEKLMELLEKNERSGVVYHYEGSYSGDYDLADEDEVRRLLLNGKKS